MNPTDTQTNDGGWRRIDDRDPKSIPKKTGHYLVACEGGNVDVSFFVDSLLIFGNRRLPSRKLVGKYSRHFELSQRAYKITHWQPLPAPPKEVQA